MHAPKIWFVTRTNRASRRSPRTQIELPQTIPGVGEKVAQVIIAEIGAEMSRFPAAAHLAA
jgi:transposase